MDEFKTVITLFNEEHPIIVRHALIDYRDNLRGLIVAAVQLGNMDNASSYADKLTAIESVLEIVRDSIRQSRQ